MSPLVENHLMRTVRNYLRRVFGIEANVRLNAKTSVQLGRTNRCVLVRCPFPNGKNLWVMRTKRGEIFGIGRYGQTYQAFLVSIEVGLNRSSLSSKNSSELNLNEIEYQ